MLMLVREVDKVLLAIAPSPASPFKSINQFTFSVFRTHQGSQQTTPKKAVYTKHSIFKGVQQ